MQIADRSGLEKLPFPHGKIATMLYCCCESQNVRTKITYCFISTKGGSKVEDSCEETEQNYCEEHRHHGSVAKPTDTP